MFPSEDALKKALYLSTMNITKKWTVRVTNWGMIYGELRLNEVQYIHFGERLSDPTAVSGKKDA